MFCRRCNLKNATPAELNRQAVRDHIHKSNDEWFQARNPMMTHGRRKELQLRFAEASSGSESSLLDLRAAFAIMFTEAEREHLLFEHFLEDWLAFTTAHPDLPPGHIGVKTAVAFINEMQ